MTKVLDIALKQHSNGSTGPAEGISEADLREVRIRHVRELYRYGKVSEWAFDLLYRCLLNFGEWVVSLALGLKSGYLAFHSRRRTFAEESRMRPPIFISEAEANRHLQELERKVTLIMR